MSFITLQIIENNGKNYKQGKLVSVEKSRFLLKSGQNKKNYFQNVTESVKNKLLDGQNFHQTFTEYVTTKYTHFYIPICQM